MKYRPKLIIYITTKSRSFIIFIFKFHHFIFGFHYFDIRVSSLSCSSFIVSKIAQTAPHTTNYNQRYIYIVDSF